MVCISLQGLALDLSGAMDLCVSVITGCQFLSFTVKCLFVIWPLLYNREIKIGSFEYLSLQFSFTWEGAALG